MICIILFHLSICKKNCSTCICPPLNCNLYNILCTHHLCQMMSNSHLLQCICHYKGPIYVSIKDIFDFPNPKSYTQHQLLLFLGILSIRHLISDILDSTQCIPPFIPNSYKNHSQEGIYLDPQPSDKSIRGIFNLKNPKLYILGHLLLPTNSSGIFQIPHHNDSLCSIEYTVLFQNRKSNRKHQFLHTLQKRHSNNIFQNILGIRGSQFLSLGPMLCILHCQISPFELSGIIHPQVYSLSSNSRIFQLLC